MTDKEFIIDEKTERKILGLVLKCLKKQGLKVEQANIGVTITQNKETQNEKVVVSKAQFESLVNEHKSLTIKYDKVVNELSLCKDANEQ